MDLLDKYVDELKKWCEWNNYEYMSADELLAELQDSDDERSKKWLKEYIKKWDEMENK